MFLLEVNFSLNICLFSLWYLHFDSLYWLCFISMLLFNKKQRLTSVVTFEHIYSMFVFIDLAEAFIQSDLDCTQVIHFFLGNKTFPSPVPHIVLSELYDSKYTLDSFHLLQHDLYHTLQSLKMFEYLLFPPLSPSFGKETKMHGEWQGSNFF